MLYHYAGLSAQQVMNNRHKFGENIISLSLQQSLTENLQQVSTFWLIRVLVVLQILVYLGILISDIIWGTITVTDWLILLLLGGEILFVYVVTLMAGHWNKSKNRQELDILTTIMLIVLTLMIFFSYYGVAFEKQVGVQPYLGVIIISLAVLMATTISYLFDSISIRRHLAQVDVQLYKVIREGNVKHILCKDIVVGDIILLKKGDEVPADAELLEAHHLLVDESPLYGKPKCRKKPVYLTINKRLTIPRYQIMKGSILLKGEAIAKVFAVGNKTFLSTITKQYPMWQYFLKR